MNVSAQYVDSVGMFLHSMWTAYECFCTAYRQVMNASAQYIDRL